MLCQPCEGDEPLVCAPCVAVEEEKPADLKKALFDEPIVGYEQTLLDEHGTGALDPLPPSSPRPMTAAETAKHN